MNQTVINNEYCFATCADCGFETKTTLSKIEAAFDLYDRNSIWNKPCEKCHSTNKKSVGYTKPNYDEEFLEQWFHNDSYRFLEQDEAVYIAEMENLDWIISYLDRNDISNYKESVLAEALCVLVYDNYANEEEQSAKDKIIRKKNLNHILPEVIKRKEIILKHKEYIFDYLFDVVEPFLK